MKLGSIFSWLRQNSKLLALFLFVDIIFISLHIALLLGIIDYNIELSIEKDLGYAEIFQYIKEFFTALILFYLFKHTKAKVYLVWGMLFLYLLLDDSLSIHENLGWKLSQYLNLEGVLGLRPEDLGEVLMLLMVALPFLISLIYIYCQQNPKARKITSIYLLLMSILLFFAIFVDSLHVIYNENKNVFAVIEDGGEMLTMTVVFIYTLSLRKVITNKTRLR